MKRIVKAIDGFKLYALGVALILVGVLELVEVDVVASIDQSTALETIAAGWAIIGGRSAMRKLEPGKDSTDA